MRAGRGSRLAEEVIDLHSPARHRRLGVGKLAPAEEDGPSGIGGDTALTSAWTSLIVKYIDANREAGPRTGVSDGVS